VLLPIRGSLPCPDQREALLRLGDDLPGSGEDSCRQQAEDEAADMGEEGDAGPVRRGAEQPEVRLDELVQAPQAEEDPGRDLDQEHGHYVRAHPRARVQDEVGAQHGGDGAAGPKLRHLRLGGRAEPRQWPAAGAVDGARMNEGPARCPGQLR